MTVPEMLPEMICAKELFRLITFSKLMQIR